MALANGVLVHGPRHWSCAVRTEDGELKVASGRKPVRAVDVKRRLARGPARIAEVFALLPEVRREPPGGEASLPAPGRARRHGGEHGGHPGRPADEPAAPLTQESLAALLALGPAVMALRGTALAEYHGAEHISIGSYEHGAPRTREHERCGSHMIGPLLATTALGTRARLARAEAPAARRATRRRGRLGGRGGRGLLLDGRQRAPSARPRARAARPRAAAAPRHRRALAGAARGCERGPRGVPPPRIACKWPSRLRGSASHLRSSTSRSRRCGRATTPTSTSTTPARRCSGRAPPARGHAGLPEAAGRAGRHGRGDCDPQALLRRLGAS